MTCKHVNIGDIKLTFKSIRETTIEVNEYNSECTRVNYTFMKVLRGI